MASIEKRTTKKNGTVYTVRYRVGDGQHRETFATMREARTRKNEVELAAEAIHGNLATLTVEEYANEWLERNWGRLSANTRASYCGELDRHIIPLIGDVQLSRLSRRHVENVVLARRNGHERLIDDGSARHYGPVGAASERKTFRVLSTVVSGAIADGALLADPRLGVEVRKISNATIFKESRVITEADLPSPDEVDAIAGQVECTGPGYGLLVQTIGLLALRWQEAIALTRTDVVLKPALIGRKPYLRVHSSVEDVPGDYTDSGERLNRKETKTGMHREIPLSAEWVEALTVHLEQFVDDASDSLLFPDPVTGGFMRNDEFRTRVYNPARQRAGVEERHTIRNLRHLGVTLWLLSCNGDSVRAAKITGHSSYVLLKTYGGIWEGMIDDAADGHADVLATYRGSRNASQGTSETDVSTRVIPLRSESEAI